MSFAEKVAIAIDLKHETPEILKNLRELNFLQHSEIHLVHLYLSSTYTVGLGEAALIFPMEEDRKVLFDSAVNSLKKITSEILGPTFKAKIMHECLFTEDPKRTFCDYVEENKIDFIVMTARERRGFFESSFSQYVSKHTRANILILKENHS